MSAARRLEKPPSRKHRRIRLSISVRTWLRLCHVHPHCLLTPLPLVRQPLPLPLRCCAPLTAKPPCLRPHLQGCGRLAAASCPRIDNFPTAVHLALLQHRLCVWDSASSAQLAPLCRPHCKRSANRIVAVATSPCVHWTPVSAAGSSADPTAPRWTRAARFRSAGWVRRRRSRPGSWGCRPSTPCTAAHCGCGNVLPVQAQLPWGAMS